MKASMCALCHRAPPCAHFRSGRPLWKDKPAKRKRKARGKSKQANEIKLKELAVGFWREFGHRGAKSGRSVRSREDTLEGLRRVSEALPDVGADRKMRRQFMRVAEKRHSLMDNPDCFACGGMAHVRHHIIPISHGGINARKNLVSLCCDCHEEIHSWLKKAPVSGTDSGRKVRALDTPLAVETASNPGPHEASNATL